MPQWHTHSCLSRYGLRLESVPTSLLLNDKVCLKCPNLRIAKYSFSWITPIFHKNTYIALTVATDTHACDKLVVHKELDTTICDDNLQKVGLIITCVKER